MSPGASAVQNASFGRLHTWRRPLLQGARIALWATAAWCGLASAAADHALAQPPDPTASHAEGEDRDESTLHAEEANDLYERGNIAYDEGRFAEAHTAYAAAWKLHPSFEIAANLGAVELKLGRPIEAAEHLQYALSHVPLKVPAASRARVQKMFEEAAAEVTTLAIRSEPEGARISIDGRELGSAAVAEQIFVTPGEHRIVASWVGRPDVAQTVVGRPGEKLEVSLVAKPEAVIPATPPAEPAPNVVVIIAGSALAAAGIGVGIGLLVAASGEESDAESIGTEIAGAGGDCQGPSPGFESSCAEAESALSSRDSLQTGGVIAITGGAIVGAAVLTYALWPRDPEPSSYGFVPAVGPGFAGGWVRGTF